MSPAAKSTVRSLEAGISLLTAAIGAYLVSAVLWDLLVGPKAAITAVVTITAIFLWLRSHLSAERLGALAKARQKAAALLGVALVWSLIGAGAALITFSLWGMSTEPAIGPVELVMMAGFWLGVLAIAALRVARFGSEIRIPNRNGIGDLPREAEEPA